MKPKEEKETMNTEPTVTSTEAPFSLSMNMTDKHGVSTIVTIRGNSADLPEMAMILADRDELIGNLISEGWTPTVSYGRGAPKAAEAPAQQSYQQPASDAKSCACGPMQYKTGTGKTGKPWSAWFCSTKAHEPIWSR